MQNISRPAPFILLSTNHGTMIINRNDYCGTPASAFGVGHQLMTQSCFDQTEVDLTCSILRTRKMYFGNGVVAIDCGANVGVFTIEWARLMYNWGHVFSFEAQEKIFYALAGNVSINNCFNVTARYAAVGAECGIMQIPEPNYLVPSSFGSFEIKKGPRTEFIGQTIDYNNLKKDVPLIALDSLNLQRVDFLKIDVEGMEEEVLYGAMTILEKLKPVALVEVLKSDKEKVVRIFENAGYKTFPMNLNILAVHTSDPTSQHIKYENDVLQFV